MITNSIITIEAVQERLKSHGVKPSVQRMAIMQYLMEHKTHPTVDMIFSDLYPQMPTLSRTTVYNTLKILAEEGAIQMLTIDEKNARYDADISQHVHFKCRKCGEIFDRFGKFAEAPDALNTPHFTVDEIHLYCRGYCSNCKKDESEATKNIN